jgi:hypothetical protein
MAFYNTSFTIGWPAVEQKKALLITKSSGKSSTVEKYVVFYSMTLDILSVNIKGIST